MFDSGLGGLGVARQVRLLLPDHDLLYVADQGRAPYGRRPLDEVRRFSEQITEHLLREGADLIVVACNSASAVALNHLRRRHPGVPFVGMEPAVKPAIAGTRTGVVGILATAATFQGELFASLIDKYGDGASMVTRVCDGWVEIVERGEIDDPSTIDAVRKHLEPVLAAGVDTLVLGCTHYPFLIDHIRAVTGPGITIIDPAPAVARQVQRLAGPAGAGTTRIQTSGASPGVSEIVRRLVGWSLPIENVTWP